MKILKQHLDTCAIFCKLTRPMRARNISGVGSDIRMVLGEITVVVAFVAKIADSVVGVKVAIIRINSQKKDNQRMGAA